jgi:HlyD family secretion protein
MHVSVRRVVIWGGAIVVAAAGLAWLFRPAAVPVDLGEVTRGDLRITLDHEGQTRVRHRYVVAAPVAGRLRRIDLEPGNEVTAGEVVATIGPDVPPLLDARTRTAAEARVKAADAAVAAARATLAQAEAASQQAERERARLARLFAGDAVAKSDLDVAETNARVRTEAVAAARASLTAAAHEADEARAALAPAAGAGGGAVAVHAPVTGVILRRVHESETPVPAGEPLLDMADPADLEVVADYLSTDAVQMRPGLPAVIERWGGGGDLAARVRLVEPGAFTKVSALGVEEQRVNVHLVFDDPAGAWRALGDGYRVEARVVIWSGSQVLKMPSNALVRNGGAWTTYVVRDGRAESRVVEIGHDTGIEAEVRSGLAEHDRVILHPSDRIAPGVHVAER